MMSRQLRITQLDIENVGRFKRIILDFDAGVNVLCGANGVGKTSILDAVASTVVGYNSNAFIRRRADAQGAGQISATLQFDGGNTDVGGAISSFKPDEKLDGFGYAVAAPYLIYVRPSRDFTYVKKDSIKRDVDVSEFNQQVRSYAGIAADEIKDWFCNRYLMRPHGESWPVFRKTNLEVAISLFGLLDHTVSLEGVDTSTFDIVVSTSAGIIPYEYLSSGFRSSFAMILGIIKEIEYRRLDTSSTEFAGIILVDEIDLHLHPTWQLKILDVFRSVFPNAQLIVSTHSPHVVQSARSEEVTAIVVDDVNDPVVRRFETSAYGFLGWSI
ncbi:MAG: hypothetical protein EON58_07575 [Alphaproteobacteria bacterium]|nr:MAG: hypothetical protein EON58_07575 [Alphaproteobacteria bacterium]